jgi:rod shape-determining protein MreD
VVLPPYLPWFGIKPDLLLIVTVVAGLLKGVKSGAGVGLFAGILQDLFLGGVLSLMTLLKLIIGSLCGLVEGNFFKERYLFSSVIIFVATLLHEILKILFSRGYWLVLKEYVLPEAILNALLGIIIYYLLYRLDNYGGSYYE